MMDLTIREIVEACGGKLYLADGRESEWLEAGGKLDLDALAITGNIQRMDKAVVGCERVEKFQNIDICVSSVVIDSRKVESGGVFVATVGERVDGHKFVASVTQQGVALAIVQKTPKQVALEQSGEELYWGNYLLVENTLQALKDLAEYYRRKLNVKVVGITGSVGKTSTKEFIAGVLAEEYCVLKTEGNYNNEIGVPLTLFGLRPQHQVAVVEMGISEFREMHRLSKMAQPDICVITNIGQCHLESLKTRDGILAAKSEIFDYMAQDGEICLNGEDDKLLEITEIKGHKPHFFGLGGTDTQEVYAEEIRSKGLFGSQATLVLGSKECKEDSRGEDRELQRLEVQVPLPGKHMVLNAAAATCVAGLLGLAPEKIAAGISKITPVSGRTNLIRLDRYTLIDDCYNANPVSMKAAIDLLDMADTYKVAILGDMFELGENASAMHAEVGAYAAEAGVDTLICVGDESRHMYEAAKEKEESKVLYYENREALLEALATEGEKLMPMGCTVLLKASHGMNFAKVLEILRNEE